MSINDVKKCLDYFYARYFMWWDDTTNEHRAVDIQNAYPKLMADKFLVDRGASIKYFDSPESFLDFMCEIAFNHMEKMEKSLESFGHHVFAKHYIEGDPNNIDNERIKAKYKEVRQKIYLIAMN